MTGVTKEDKNDSLNSAKLPDLSDMQIPALDSLDEEPATFVRTSLMVDCSKYTLVKLLAAFRMEEIRQCLDEAILHFIHKNENEIKKAIEWYTANEKRKKERG